MKLSLSIASGDTNSSTLDATQEWGGVSGRGNTDSGFISEAPDDLVLHRDMCIDSFPGVTGTDDQRRVAGMPGMRSPEHVGEMEREGGGVVEVEEEEEAWDEVRVSHREGGREGL